MTPIKSLLVSMTLIAGMTAACASGDNREASPTGKTASRRGQGLDASLNNNNSKMSAHNEVVDAQAVSSGKPLTGNVESDTSATQDAPLNTSPSAANGLPEASTATGKPSGAMTRGKKPTMSGTTATATPTPRP